MYHNSLAEKRCIISKLLLLNPAMPKPAFHFSFSFPSTHLRSLTSFSFLNGFIPFFRRSLPCISYFTLQSTPSSFPRDLGGFGGPKIDTATVLPPYFLLCFCLLPLFPHSTHTPAIHLTTLMAHIPTYKHTHTPIERESNRLWEGVLGSVRERAERDVRDRKRRGGRVVSCSTHTHTYIHTLHTPMHTIHGSYTRTHDSDQGERIVREITRGKERDNTAKRNRDTRWEREWDVYNSQPPRHTHRHIYMHWTHTLYIYTHTLAYREREIPRVREAEPRERWTGCNTSSHIYIYI